MEVFWVGLSPDLWCAWACCRLHWMYASQKSRSKEPYLGKDVSPECSRVAHSSILGDAPGCNRTLWPFFDTQVKPKFLFSVPWQSEHCQCHVKTVWHYPWSWPPFPLWICGCLENRSDIYMCKWLLVTCVTRTEAHGFSRTAGNTLEAFSKLCHLFIDSNQMRKALSGHRNGTSYIAL